MRHIADPLSLFSNEKGELITRTLVGVPMPPEGEVLGKQVVTLNNANYTGGFPKDKVFSIL
jgi:hypothetical protein